MSEGRIVDLVRANSPGEAQVIVAVLRSAGIPAFVGGQLLQDEFAASQRLLGLQGVDIQVPEEARVRAMAVLAEARRDGRHLDRFDDEDPEEDRREDPPR